MTRLRKRQPFLDKTNTNDIIAPKMATKTQVVLRKPSTRVRKTTEWKRVVPGEKIPEKDEPLRRKVISSPVKRDRRVVAAKPKGTIQNKSPGKISPKGTKTVKGSGKKIDKCLLTPRVSLTRLQISPKKNLDSRMSKSPAKNGLKSSKTAQNDQKDQKGKTPHVTSEAKSPVKNANNDSKSPRRNPKRIQNSPKKVALKRNIRTRTQRDLKSTKIVEKDLKSPNVSQDSPKKSTPKRILPKRTSNVALDKISPTKTPKIISSPKKVITRISISPKRFFKSPSRTAITPKFQHSPTKISKCVPARTLATKLKKSLNTTVKNTPKILPKRLASKKAITKIVSALRVSSSSPVVEKQVDIFDFTFDSDEEPVKTKKTRLREIVDDSGDENNSMKGVVRQLRRNEQRKKRMGTREKKVTMKNTAKGKGIIDKDKIVEGIKQKTAIKDTTMKEVGNHAKTIEKITKVVDPNVITKPLVKNPNNVVKIGPLQVKPAQNVVQKVVGKENIPKTLPEKICASFDDDFDDWHDYQDSPVAETHKTITEEICNSFMASLEETSTHLSPGKMISDDVLNQLKGISAKKSESPKIKVISNVVVKPKNVFNNTTNSILDESNPWRLSISHIKNPHTFTVKDKSFIPNYDQEIVINSTFTDKLKSSEDVSTPKKLPESKFTYQSSILNFVSSSKENKNEVMKAGSLFHSPRKVLAEINFTQSTPFHPQQKITSPNISIIAERNDISNLFGFSCDENSENVPPGRESKRIKKRSPKKEKVKAVLFSEVVEVKKIEEEQQRIDEMQLSNEDLDMLFQDVENDKLQVKKSRRSYERSRPKRRRLPSVDSVESDDESIAEVKIKAPSKRTKKEEEEVDRLASHYNSMFEEIDKFDLIVE